ncbi:hypothetical protein LZ554_007611 [Drepanopeziza brunnea f. sp. 'monogermtubi']|nr:hypothetical protein LZ554_007611 [Drepanopeziza brunnea f. sp. 'monogermtubi']
MSVQESLGFSAPDFSWDQYVKHRPAYRAPFWARIYDYHASHGSGHFGVAHDVGAGAGIASQELASRFRTVIVSDPNEDYIRAAAARLTASSSPHLGLPKEERFTFLRESGEQSSVRTGTVDVLVVCEAIHFMDIDRAMREFARQLKPGGTLAISYYGRPHVRDDARARSVWDRMFDVWAEGNFERSEVFRRAFRNGVTGLDNVPFSPEFWEEGARRVKTNTGGRADAFLMSARYRDSFPSRLGDGDVVQWVEEDQDWVDEVDLQGLKGVFASFIPAPADDKIKGLWAEMEDAVKSDKRVKITWPFVQLLATRRDVSIESTGRESCGDFGTTNL